ncbi:hypothetical protein GCM10009609_17230 [Pseudonocardia aurantiaca]|uniref:Uncharacterized protein n=1 Tax=Pseudonocardia aurantiaca TaxID=75290 RepID=A0ABW4FU97_9PSEU
MTTNGIPSYNDEFWERTSSDGRTYAEDYLAYLDACSDYRANPSVGTLVAYDAAIRAWQRASWEMTRRDGCR